MPRLFLLIIALCFTLHAQELRLPNVFGSHMVLQRDLVLPIWGWAAANAAVSVSFASQTASAKANASGEWSLKLTPLAVSSKAQELRVKSGDQQVELTDILVGDAVHL